MPRHSRALMLEGLRRAGADLAEQTRATAPVRRPIEIACPACSGRGHIGFETCPLCLGVGLVLTDDAEERAAFEADPPPDIEPLGDDEPREDYVRDLQDRFPDDLSDDADALASAGRGTDEDYE